MEIQRFPAVIGEDAFFRRSEAQRGASESGREFSDPFWTWPAFEISGFMTYLRIVVHDERRRSLRAGEDPRATRTSR
jgi:hypothetical protein